MENHPYLKNKIITIEVLPAPEMWKEHFSKFAKDVDFMSFVTNNFKDKPYSYPGTEKRFCVPLSQPGVKPTLDSTIKQKCFDFQNQELTEQEYFEKKLNKNLNPYLDIEENWWADVDKNKIAFPIIKEGRLRLDLSKVSDMIQYRIFQEHYTDEIAFSLAELKQKRLNTYMYIVKDASVEDTESLKSGKNLMEAAIECAKIAEDKESIIKFFACLGRSLDSKQSLAVLQKPLYDMMAENPSGFLVAARDPDMDLKYLIYKGRKTGVITYLPKNDEYALPSGKTGKLNTLISHLKSLDSEKEFFELEHEINNKYVV